MKKLILAFLLVLFITVPAFAASLVWNYDAGHDVSIGYTVYFTDGVKNYNKTFLVADCIVNGTEVRYDNIETILKLHYGVQYTFELARYNDAGESGHSNSITWTRNAYVPPTDSLPGDVGGTPSSAGSLGIQ